MNMRITDRIERALDDRTPRNPEVGMGATVYVGSDRYAYTVISISPSGNVVTIQRDDTRILRGNVQSEGQTYLYAPNPKGKVEFVRRRSDGQWRTQGRHGSLVHFGMRDAYSDPSF